MKKEMPLEGFAGFKWGTAVDDLKNKFHGMVEISENEPEGYRRFASPGGDGKTIELFFHANKLFMGRVIYKNSSREKVKAEIEQEYGQVHEQTELGDVWDYSMNLGISLTNGESDFDCLYYVRKEFYPYLDGVKKNKKA